MKESDIKASFPSFLALYLNNLLRKITHFENTIDDQSRDNETTYLSFISQSH